MHTSDAAATTYDPFDESFQSDPYPFYKLLRDEDPVHHSRKLGVWALSRFEDVWNAVENTRDFSSASGLTFYEDEIARLGLPPTIVMLDPPRHTLLRRLISRGFTRTGVRGLETPIRAFVDERIDAMERAAADGRTPDLHRDLSSPLPSFVLGTLLGVPESDRQRFAVWVRAMVRLQNEPLGEMEPTAKEAVGEMFSYFGEVIAARRTAPADDLISALVQAEVDGEKLTDWDVLGFCFVIVAGGTDTTANLISHGVTLLTQEPDQRRRLASDPSLIPNALMEFLRMESSVQALARTTTRPVRLHDVEIPEGSKVMMLYGSANQDEREFGEDAGRLDVGRNLPRHLGFAAGAHFCLGAQLAQLMSRVTFEQLLGRHPEVEADLARAERLRSPFTRGWVSLPATGVEPR